MISASAPPGAWAGPPEECPSSVEDASYGPALLLSTSATKAAASHSTCHQGTYFSYPTTLHVVQHPTCTWVHAHAVAPPSILAPQSPDLTRHQGKPAQLQTYRVVPGSWWSTSCVRRAGSTGQEKAVLGHCCLAPVMSGEEYIPLPGEGHLSSPLLPQESHSHTISRLENLFVSSRSMWIHYSPWAGCDFQLMKQELDASCSGGNIQLCHRLSHMWGWNRGCISKSYSQRGFRVLLLLAQTHLGPDRASVHKLQRWGPGAGCRCQNTNACFLLWSRDLMQEEAG